MNSRGKTLAIALSSLMGTLATGQAQADDEGWNFSVAPLYLWGKSIEAQATAGPTSLPLDLDFQDDVFENLDAAFAIHFEANYGDVTWILEYNWARLDPTTEQNVGPIDINADVEFEDTMWEGALAWAFADNGKTRWEAYGGIRYLDQEVDIEIKTSLPIDLPLPNEVTAGDDWVHPFAGIRVTRELSQRWSFRGRADYGYESSDNSALQGIFFFDYRFRDWGSAFVGYRYLDMEFENNGRNFDGYGFDGDQQGPLIGMNLYF